MKALLQRRVALCRGLVLGAGVLQLRQLPAQPLHLALHVAQLVEDRQALLEDAAPRQQQALLGQVADAHAAGLLHLAVVQRLLTRQHLHQRRLAGAVGAHQRRLLARPDQPVGLQKQDSRSKPLAGILQGEHLLLFSQTAGQPLGWGQRDSFCPSGGARVKSPAFVCVAVRSTTLFMDGPPP